MMTYKRSALGPPGRPRVTGRRHWRWIATTWSGTSPATSGNNFTSEGLTGPRLHR